MNKIAIVTDSSAGIPLELAKEFEIEIIPLGIQLDQQMYKEEVDLSRDEFYKQLSKGKNLSTSQPSPGEFISLYKKLAQDADEIISIHVTSLASGTFNSANLAKGEVSIPVTVIDSQATSMAQGFMALAAAQASKAGLSSAEIAKIIDRVREQSIIHAILPSLKYLKRSGRVNLAQSMVGELLSIKPILGIENGEIIVASKTRSMRKGIKQMIDMVNNKLPQKQLQVAVLHSNSEQKALELREQLKSHLNCTNLVIADVGAALAVHGGPGILGIAAYAGTDLKL